MPHKIEIVSSKVSAIVREVKIRNSVVTVRRSRVSITKENVYILMLLEVFGEKKPSFEPEEAYVLQDFTKRFNITFEDFKRYSVYFPKWTMRNLIDMKLEYIFS